jgi:methionyl-tRNA formyltransferase
VRTVFLGTSEFAAAVLEHLVGSASAAENNNEANAAQRPQLVLTRPDRPRGRGRRMASPPVAEAARALGIPLAQPESVNAPEARERIALVKPDAVVVCAFGALIKEPLLSEYELLNVHPSLLPRWRGAAPIERAIMAGDSETGVSIMRLTAGLDNGPVCLVAREPIRPDDSYGSLTARLQKLGGELLVRALERPEAFVEQDETGVTYAEKIGPKDRLLDPARPAVELERVVRALHPHVGARVEMADGTLLGVHRARLVDAETKVEMDAEARVDAGMDAEAKTGVEVQTQAVVGESVAGARDGHRRLLLHCRTGVLELLEVQPPGGRTMDAAAFLRGRGLPGER